MAHLASREDVTGLTIAGTAHIHERPQPKDPLLFFLFIYSDYIDNILDVIP